MTGELLLAGVAALAIFFSLRTELRRYAFSVWISVAFAGAMVVPEAFTQWGDFDPAKLIVPLLQIIMFGMGTTLTLNDFGRALRHPKPVFLGIGAQFLVMPVAGFFLARVMGLGAEVMAGVILVGSVSGGVASNLMVFLARGNVALSVTMTACSTMLSPVVTPLLMKFYAGTILPISFLAMMLSILNMVITPILAGLIANWILYSTRPEATRLPRLFITALLSAACALIAYTMDGNALGKLGVIRPGFILGSLLIAVVTLVRIIALFRQHPDSRWIDGLLPLISMAGIWIIIAIITARSRDTLMAIGTALIVTATLHNTLGFLFGYWSGRVARLSESDCRTVAFEVGMQNSGMAAGLAMDSLKSASAALAPAIFGPLMNISGSFLASWWAQRQPEEETSLDRTLLPAHGRQRSEPRRKS